jgi:thiosulfate/3-mercaptopyruvate sulfurtransferase
VAPLASPLISVSTLDSAIQSIEDITVLDVRWTVGGGSDYESYLRGHVRGAVFVDLESELSDPPGPRGRHPLPSPERFTAAMQKAGIGPSSWVVCYDTGPGFAAARLWWLLRYFGHSEISVVDGGYRAWAANSFPVEKGPVAAIPGDFIPGHSLTTTLTVDAISDFIAEGGLLLDARDTDRYLGIREPIDSVGGHIPGAVSAPTSQYLQNDDTFRDPAELRALFQRLGAGSNPVAVYCGSGITAAHGVLGLELAGYSAALYPGSWSEWIVDPSRPVATDS